MDKRPHMGNQRVYTDEERAERKKAHQKAYRERNAEKIRAYNEKNSERNAAAKKSWYARNRDVLAEKWQARYSEKREELLQYQTEHYKKNGDKIKARVAKWKRENPGKVAAICQNRRAKKAMANGQLSPGLADRLMDLQRGLCAACRCDLKSSGRHLDHIQPLSKNGSNTDSNIQLLCPSCNSSKHSKHPIEFMQQRGFLL